MVPGQEVTRLVFEVLCISMLFIDLEIFRSDELKERRSNVVQPNKLDEIEIY